MALFRWTKDNKGSLETVPRTEFVNEHVQERDLQRLLRDRPEAIDPDLFIVTEEFSDWEGSDRRVDLLGLDSEGNLVVIELKRNEDSFMDLQAIRYAALVSPLTFNDLVEAHREYLDGRGRKEDSRNSLLKFLGKEQDDDVEIGSQPRIVLVAQGFSTELTTAVIWLIDQGLDIKCVQAIPYGSGEAILIDVRQIIPLPQVEDYRVKIRDKAKAERETRQAGQRRERALSVLVREGLIKPGTPITLLPLSGESERIDSPERRARFADDVPQRNNVVWEWEKDEESYSLSGLCKHMIGELGLKLPDSAYSSPYEYWSLEGSDKSLWTLAERYRGNPEGNSDSSQ